MKNHWTFLLGVFIGGIVGVLVTIPDGPGPFIVPINEPTPAVQRADPGLAMGLAELASDEHRARIQAERNLDELRREAQSVVAKLLSEIQRLQKRPTLKKGSIDS